MKRTPRMMLLSIVSASIGLSVFTAGFAVQLQAQGSDTAGSVIDTTPGTTEGRALAQELQRLDGMLAQATTESEKQALIQKISYVKQRIATLDSAKTTAPVTTTATSEADMLRQELQRCNDLLAKAATEAEKQSLIQKIEYLKNRLSTISSGTPVKTISGTTYGSEREMLLAQIDQLNKAIAAATGEDDKKMFAEKIAFIKQRIAQIDSNSTRVPTATDTARVRNFADQLKYIDELIAKKRSELTALIQSGENEKALAIEREITALLEKRKVIESQAQAVTRPDSAPTAETYDKAVDSLVSRDERYAQLQQRYTALKAQLDTLNNQVAHLKSALTEAENTGEAAKAEQLKNQLALLNEKANSLFVAQEKIRIEAEQLQAAIASKEETSQLKETAAATKIETDSLLRLLQEKNKLRMELMKENGDAQKIAGLTGEMLALKQEFLNNQRELGEIRTAIEDVRAENQQTQRELRVEKVELVASENRNARGLYEVTMDRPVDDTSSLKGLKVKLNVLDNVGGEIEIAEQVIEEAPAGKRGLCAFDITPSVDLQINLEDAQIELPFDLEGINNTDAQKLAIYYCNPAIGWERVEGCTVDAERKVVIAKVTHFSVYGVFAEETVTAAVTGMNKLTRFTLAARNVNTTVAFDFTVPVKSFVQLHIYSLDGRLMAKPVSGVFNAGAYSFVWNGRNGFRSSAATGKYIARLMMPDQRITRTFTMIR